MAGPWCWVHAHLHLKACRHCHHKGLSRDLAKDNILVTTVCIGLIKSGQHERRYARLKATNPDFTMEELYAQE